MNTREREVMDAVRVVLANANGSRASGYSDVPWTSIDALRRTYDALLAEGSASSEGAEAVAPAAYCDPRDPFNASAFAWPGTERERRHSCALYNHPQPAHGEPATAAALAQFIREIDGKHELGAGALAEKIVERFALPRGEHEQRSCEGSERLCQKCYGTHFEQHCPACGPGSERRPIADEVVELPYFVEVDKNGCSSCGHGRSWTVVGPGDVAEGQSWLDEDEASHFCECMNDAYHCGFTSALESAHPRGLPAGSDAKDYAVVPRSLPFEVLSDAALNGVFETGNPKHGWDYLLAKVGRTP